MTEKSLKKNAFYGFIKAFMNLAFPILSFPYASRILLPEGIGKVNFANSVADYFIMIGGLGIFSYASREAAKIRNDQKAFNQFAKEMFVINMAATLASYILLFYAVFFIPKLSDYRILIIICSSKILFETVGLNWLYNAEEEYRYITIRSVFFQAISLVFLFLFVKTKDDYMKYAVMGIISSVGSNICNLFYSRKYITLFAKYDDLKFHIKKHLKPIFIFFGMSIAGKIYATIDTMMLGFMKSDSEIGYYSAANKITNMVIGLISGAIATMLPRSSYYLENDEEKYTNLVKKAMNSTVFFAIPATAGLFLLCRPLVLLFSGENYLPSVLPMEILSPLIFFSAADAVFNTIVLTPQRKEKYILIAQIIGCCINFVMNALLIPHYGVPGAVIGSVLSESVITTLLFLFSRGHYYFSSVRKNCIQCIFSTCIMGAFVFCIVHFISSTIVQVVAGVIIGCIVYACSTLLMKNEVSLLIVNTIKKRLELV
jgi:O-antigen/teichoic acid export membrane protein